MADADDDLRLFNKMAAGMDAFHEGFRVTSKTLYAACAGEGPPMAAADFVATALAWCNALDEHHRVEEQHVFPRLAVKMPAFRRDASEPASADSVKLLTQHRQIHAGLDALHTYLDDCHHARASLDLARALSLLNSFHAVLLQHMDDEVDQLRADNMRRFWSADEMRALPFKVQPA